MEHKTTIFQTLLFMEIKNKILIVSFILFLGNSAYGQHLDGYDLNMKEVCIVNKDIKSCLNEIIPYIISKYSFFNKEREDCSMLRPCLSKLCKK